MRDCINCDATFPKGERRGSFKVVYKGYYCKECEVYRREHGELPEP